VIIRAKSYNKAVELLRLQWQRRLISVAHLGRYLVRAQGHMKLDALVVLRDNCLPVVFLKSLGLCQDRLLVCQLVSVDHPYYLRVKLPSPITSRPELSGDWLIPHSCVEVVTQGEPDSILGFAQQADLTRL